MRQQLQMAISVDVPAEQRSCSGCEWGTIRYDEGRYRALCFDSRACPQVEGVGAEVECERAQSCAWYRPGFVVRALHRGATVALSADGDGNGGQVR